MKPFVSVEEAQATIELSCENSWNDFMKSAKLNPETLVAAKAIFRVGFMNGVNSVLQEFIQVSLNETKKETNPQGS